MGHEVRVVMPLYAAVDRARWGLQVEDGLCVHFGAGEECWGQRWRGIMDNQVPTWFLEYDRFFGRGGIYDDGTNEYLDNAYRFGFLSKAALQMCKDWDWIPDVIHVHDWQTAMVPGFLRTWDRILSPLSGVATVLTIHNIGYQGVYGADVLKFFGWGKDHFRSEVIEDHGRVNLMKAGIYFADKITTVSPTHAGELLDPVGGCGLAPYLEARRADFCGILNGADYDVWDPATDDALPARFSSSDLSGKLVCREKLREHFGLENNGTPIFGMVSRLVEQKGMGLLQGMLERAVQYCSMQFVVLGTGDPRVHGFLDDLAWRYPGRVGVHIGFSNELSRLIYAGSDFFLMPSLYEPCGLSQMYAMRYGSVPVVRATGGLVDTVQDGVTGVVFHRPDAGDLYHAVERAVRLWYDTPEQFQRVRAEAMARRFTWKDAARCYEGVYWDAIGRRRWLGE